MPDLDDDSGAADDAPAFDSEPQETLAPEAPRSRLSGGFLVAVTLAAVFFVTTVGFAVLAVGERSGDEELVEDRDEIAAVARQLMDELLHFDYRDPDANREALLALSAAQFRSQFEAAFETNMALFTELEMISTPTIQDVFVSEIVDDQSSAIVKYDRVIETAERTNRETGFYAEVELAKIDGEWLVMNVFNINFALAGGGGGLDAGSTSTTVAPPP